ncbi:unnamed protein product [Owenia fusiformis]|uniref:Uncharacterized protein n=1 Tax=Owenia fusiformis TaxID=6347 RepID=A0A8J1TF50_OWEFU|nr:unnamed protein product [Owenia fusiformis]
MLDILKDMLYKIYSLYYTFVSLFNHKHKIDNDSSESNTPEKITDEAIVTNAEFGNVMNEARQCEPCMDGNRGTCTLELEDQVSILFGFDGVKRVGLKPNETNFSIYLHDKDDDSTKMKIKEKYPQHKFNFRASPRTKSFSLGCAVMGERIGGTPTMGTLGGHISFNSNIYGLTCHHVVKGVPHGGAVGVYKNEQARITWDPIGTVECTIAHDHPGKQVETYDIALIKMAKPQQDDCRSCETDTIDGLTQQRNENQAVGEITVHKKGAVTGETESIISDLRYAGKIPFEIDGITKDVTLLRAIQIKNDGPIPFAKKGDSGSIVYHRDDSKNLVIGMFYALETTDEGNFAYAFPLQNALEKLKDMYPDILRDATFGPNGNVKFTCYGEICQEAMEI